MTTYFTHTLHIPHTSSDMPSPTNYDLGQCRSPNIQLHSSTRLGYCKAMIENTIVAIISWGLSLFYLRLCIASLPFHHTTLLLFHLTALLLFLLFHHIDLLLFLLFHHTALLLSTSFTSQLYSSSSSFTSQLYSSSSSFRLYIYWLTAFGQIQSSLSSKVKTSNWQALKKEWWHWNCLTIWSINDDK